MSIIFSTTSPQTGTRAQASHALGSVISGEAVTPLRTNAILCGITRSVVLGLCRELGIAVREKALSVEEAEQAEELMIVGAIVEVTPVLRILNGSFRAAGPGPVARSLQAAFRERVRPA